jgi:hypothetical protein
MLQSELFGNLGIPVIMFLVSEPASFLGGQHIMLDFERGP